MSEIHFYNLEVAQRILHDELGDDWNDLMRTLCESGVLCAMRHFANHENETLKKENKVLKERLIDMKTDVEYVQNQWIKSCKKLAIVEKRRDELLRRLLRKSG